MDILKPATVGLYHIVETGGFTKAARKLHLTQSALSHQIKSLETQLQAPVFARLGKRVVLTQSGEVLLPYATAVLEQLACGPRGYFGTARAGRGRYLRVSAASYSCYQILPQSCGNFVHSIRMWNCSWQRSTPIERCRAC